MKRLLLFFLLAPAAFAQCPGHSYSTTFPANQNPISEGNCWFNGTVDGTFWGNVQTSGGQAHGTITNSNPSFTAPFNDSTAVLKGTWGPNQYVRATVRINAQDSSSQQEIELRTHTTITPNSTTGYEYDVNVKNGQAYVVIVRWNPGTNQFTYCQNNSTCTGTLATNSISTVDGDVWEANSIGSKHTLYKNGTAVFTTTDATYTNGSPGIGFWMVEGSSQTCSGGYGTAPCSHLLDFGLTNFSASDSTYVAATCNQTDVNALINGPTHTAANGDTVEIPAGSCTWNAGITVPNGLGITIIGSGTQNTNSVCTATSQVGCGAGTPTTIITDSAGGSHAIVQTPTFGTASLARVSTIQWVVGATTTQAVSFGGNCTAGGCPNIRVDNLVVPPWTVGTLAFSYMTNVFGVMDHNTVNYLNTTGIGQNETFVDIGHGHYQGNVVEAGGVPNNWGDSSWASADTFGTQQALYLENNIIAGQVATDTEGADGAGTWGGARFVCRFNYFTVIHQNGGCTAHGTDTGGRNRGVRQWEMYGNYGLCTQFSGGTLNCNSFAPTRGGVGRVWNNKVIPGSTPAGQGGVLKSLGTTDTQRTWRLLGVWGVPGNSQCNGQSAWDNNDGVTYYPPSGSATITAVSDSTVNGFNQWFVTVQAPGGGSPGWTANQWAPASVTDWDYEFVDVTNAAHPNFGYLIVQNTANVLTLQNDGNGAGGTPVIGDSIQILRSKVCIDQMGRSGGVLVKDSSDTNGVPVLSTTGVPGPLNQSIDPSYEANDTLSATSVSTVPSSGNVQVLRDTFSETVNQAPNTTPTAPFNGSNGGGSGHGPIAQRPASGVLNAGYLATDQGNWNQVSGGIQGQWFKWNGSSWVSEPVLTYPHPLITGAPGVVSVSPSSMNFGSVVVGAFSSAQTATLTNGTGASITLSPVTITGSNPADFSIGANNCNSGTVAANGGTCSVTMQFAPTSTGARSATLTIVTSAGSFPVSMSGTGTSAVNPGISISPASAAFGNITVGVHSAATTFTMTSTTTANLVMSTPPATITGANPGDFALVAVGGQCTNGQSIPQSSTCTESVVFTPSATGARSAQLNIFDNVTGSPQVQTLSGTGVGVITLNPASLNFGLIAQGQTSVSQTVTVTNNTGIVPLALTGTSFTNPDFAATANNCNSGSLANGASCQVTITFRPSATTGTNETGFLLISYSGFPTSQVPLAGTVLPPIVTPAATLFAVTVVGTGFMPNSVVYQNGVACPGSSYVSPTTMTAKCPAMSTFTVVLPALTTVRVNAGGPAYTDTLGNVWAADKGFAGGQVAVFPATTPITGTTEPTLYKTERWGYPGFSYTFPVSNGNYNVTLKFVENYFQSPGNRIFNVVINGKQVLTNFDIFAAAGARYKAVDKIFPVAVSGGSINIQFVNDAAVAAIQIAGS